MKFIGCNLEECYLSMKDKINKEHRFHLFFLKKDKKVEIILYEKFYKIDCYLSCFERLRLKKIEEFPKIEFRADEKLNNDYHIDHHNNIIECDLLKYSINGLISLKNFYYPYGHVEIFPRYKIKSYRKFYDRATKFGSRFVREKILNDYKLNFTMTTKFRYVILEM